jgi:hypothetical protein
LNCWTNAEHSFLRSLVDMAAGGENVEVPALGFGKIAKIMNDYVVSNGPTSKNGRLYKQRYGALALGAGAEERYKINSRRGDH